MLAAPCLVSDIMGPWWIWCMVPVWIVVSQIWYVGNPPYIWEQISQCLMEEYGCKVKQSTCVALGSETTLIGFGEVIQSKGTPLWQSDSQEHESLKPYPVVILDHHHQPRCLHLLTHRAEAVCNQVRNVTINGPIYSAGMAVITDILHLSPRKAMDAPLLTIATWNRHMGRRPLGVMGGADSLTTTGSSVTSSWESALSSHQQISL